MKNESDASTTKSKNESFYEKLDKDRKDKKCEYAVLVSLLEQDNELFNTGIVDVYPAYEKMKKSPNDFSFAERCFEFFRI